MASLTNIHLTTPGSLGTPHPVPSRDISLLDAKTQELFHRTLDVAKELDTTGVTSIHDIIPCTELFNLYPARFDELYKKYGERFLEYIECMVKLECARQAYMSTAEHDPEMKSLQFPNASYNLAMTNEKIAGCAELSLLAIHIASKKGIFGYNIVCSDKSLPYPYYHSFTVMVSDKAEADPLIDSAIKGSLSFFGILKHIKGVIYDPYLKVVVPSELAEDHPEFRKGIEAMRIKDVYSFHPGPLPHQIPILTEQSAKLTAFIRAKKILKESVLPEETHWPMIRDFALHARKDLIIAELIKLSPETTWKYSAKARCIYATFTEAQGTAVNATLGGKGITSVAFAKLAKQTTPEALYGIQIKIPDFGAKELLDKLRA
jgi:hypothetical protein